jgi:hypothetical protein
MMTSLQELHFNISWSAEFFPRDCEIRAEVKYSQWALEETRSFGN